MLDRQSPRGHYNPVVILAGDVGGRLHGAKLFVKDAHIADDFIVVTRGDNGWNLLLLEATTPGISLQPVDVISDEKLFEVAFDDIPVTEAMRIGQAGSGWADLAPALQLGALARCAEIVGCAQRILDICSGYAKVREQSGRPIGAFQAVKHPIVDTMVGIEQARNLSLAAAVALDVDAARAEPLARAAKAMASDAYVFAGKKGVQLHGGYGFTWDCDVHFWFKRALVSRALFGDAHQHRAWIAEQLFK